MQPIRGLTSECDAYSCSSARCSQALRSTVWSRRYRVWITGEVTVTTSESLTLTVVRVKGRMWRNSIRSGEHHVVFCVTHAKPIASKLNDRGGGRVVYRTPRSEKSAGYGPRSENMLPALGVLQANGESPFFLAAGQSYPHPPHERSVGNVSTFAIVNLARHDVRDLKGKRQKTDAPCRELRVTGEQNMNAKAIVSSFTKSHTSLLLTGH